MTKVVQQVEFATNPSGMTSLVVGAMGNVPDVKLVSFSGGQFVGAAGIYMKAAGKAPGEVKVIGFDILPAVITAMQQNWAHRGRRAAALSCRDTCRCSASACRRSGGSSR